MNNSWLKFSAFSVLLAISLITGCFNSSENAGGVPVPVEPMPTANVTFVIEGKALPQSSLRAAATPAVTFQLELLNPTSSSNPVLKFVKTATVSAEGSNFSAQVEFVNVPALACMAKMSISGGTITSTTDSQKYANWVGTQDLVAGSGNVITLYGEGSKTRADVAYNLLQQLIADPKNVAFFPTPTLTKVYEVVDSLNLSSTSVYTDAKSAWDQKYSTPLPPADAEFTLPTGYSSVAYPKKDATTNLSIANFGSTSEVYLVFANRTSSVLSPSWSVSRATANLKASVAAENSPVPSGDPITDEQKFHLMLRQLKNKLPPVIDGVSSIRPSIRAVSLNDVLSFKAYFTGGVVTTFNATCKKVVDISGTTKKAYFFLDNNDLSQTGATTIIDGIATNWASIYATNRNIFGAEPEGTLNGINVQDFYIVLSSKIYTAGYFYSGDMYPATTPGVAYSNEKKLFNLQFPTSSTDLTRSITDLSSTMAHEFQHMIHFYQKRALNDPSYWLDEAMSGYAEQVNGYRIENGMNQSKALQVQKYLSYVNRISINEWHADNDVSDIIHGHYGKAYLFGTWLALNYGSSGSVQNLLSVQLLEESAVSAFTGETFDKTAAKFMMALLVNDSAGGIYGIKGLDLTNTYSFGTGWSDVTLSGPTMTTVNFLGSTSGSPSIYPYASAFVKVTNGTGTTLNVTATLPSGVSLFQLKKN
ncbi:MAG: M30 family zinc metallopeptidase [Candidatus Rifleibacteriota bacterium]